MEDIVRTYLREIGRIPLLTHEQEVAYGQQVHHMMLHLTAKETLSKKLRREPTFKEWASCVQLGEVELNKTIRQGQRAKQKMVEA